MISKSKIKLIKSLKYKKTRDELNLFLVEGLKGILEVNKSNYYIHFTVISKKIYNQYKNFLPSNNIFILEENEINELSSLQNNLVGFCVVKTILKDLSQNNLDKITIALDSISDPGNLGAIIRNADWFGIKNIICCVILLNMFTQVQFFFFLMARRWRRLGAFLEHKDAHVH